MALDAFEGAATAQTLVGLARRRAGSPSLQLDPDGNETIDAPAYQELQFILDGLALNWDWPFARVIRTLSVSGRTTALPTEFWRISFDDPMYLLDGCGGRVRIHLDDEPGFFDSVNQPLVYGTPERFWIHKQNQVFYVEPVPARPAEVEFHFQPWQIPLAEITSKPWFPYSEYLVSALSVKLNLGQDDARAAAEDALATKLMKAIRGAQNDQGDRTHQIVYNPLYFKPMLRI